MYKKRILEDMGTNKCKLDCVEKMVDVKEEYMAQLAKEQEIREKEDNLKEQFLRQWKDLEHHGHYKVYAFVINDLQQFTYVGVLAEKDGQRSVYYVKGFCKTIFLELNKNREGYTTLPYTVRNGKFTLDIIYLPTNEPLATFDTNGTTTYYGHSFPKIENLRFYNNNNSDTTDIPSRQVGLKMSSGDPMQEIKGNIKFKECGRLEDLKECAEFTINAIKQVEYRGKKRYILQLKNMPNLYVSNYWLENEFNNGQFDFNHKIRIKLGRLKTTPNKNKEMQVFCATIYTI